MPSRNILSLLEKVPGLKPMAKRLGRRNFPPLNDAPKVQARLDEINRLAKRAIGLGDESLSYQANDWLMRTMARECKRPTVAVVHTYEDCALLPFAEAKRLGKACIYDMPIGYYRAWEETQAELARAFVDWLPSGGLSSSRFVRPQQKYEEMALADLVLAPSTFVADTVRTFHADKPVAVAPYGVDSEYWTPPETERTQDTLRFIYAGQISLRKGIPALIEAWEAAALQSAELHLVGSWFLNDNRRRDLPQNVFHLPPCSSDELREQYRRANVFVFPSYFEGFGLVLLEALACGLPTIASTATIAPDVLTVDSGKVIPTADPHALVEALRWFDQNRHRVSAMGREARKQAEGFTWERYRRTVTDATKAFH